jgi:CubicO group peptidase (beta-lactamase class C family)
MGEETMGEQRRAGARLRIRGIATGVALVAVAGSITPLSAQVLTVQRVDAQRRDPLPAVTAQIERKYPTVRSLVLARGNCIVYEHYWNNTADARWPVNSVTKSVLSILVGIAIDKGLLRLDQKLSELLPDTARKTSDPHASEITLRDLLTMTSGFDPDNLTSVRGVWNSSVWMTNRSVKYTPGVHFYYDNPGADLISIILARVVKDNNIAEFVRQELFSPLGIESYEWSTDMDGNLRGAFGLRLTARDMAKVGTLYLQHGRWHDRQLVSKDYVIDSTRRHNNGGAPVKAGYGYLWWTTKTNDGVEPYFAAGSGSQLIYNVPDRNLVVALSSAASVPGGSQRFVNDVVLPAEAVLSAQAPCIGRLE